MNCATCKSWSIQTTWLVGSNMAPCALGKIYTVLGPGQSCARHSPLEPVLFAKRAKWLARFLANIAKKHNFGVTA